MPVTTSRKLARRAVLQAVRIRAFQAKQAVAEFVPKAVARRVYYRQVKSLEKEIEDALAPMFADQIKSAAKNLGEMDGTKTRQPNPVATQLAQQIFRPKEWDQELVNRMLPVMANGFSEGMRAQLRLMGVDVKDLKFCRTLIGLKELTTATEWLEAYGEELSEVVFDTPMGQMAIAHVTEYPPWMKESIQDLLKESFSQDYWEKVNQTTLGDIERFLEEGLREGWSIERMATKMAPELLRSGNYYGKRRGKLIARTEAGHALNGSRVASIDAMIGELGDELPMKKTWLSVLGDTTRDTHADLDGVPADKDGLWELGGVRIRWPGDVRLPVNERANCQCSVVVSYGMTDQESMELIGEYQSRLEQQGKSLVWSIRTKEERCLTKSTLTAQA